MAVADFAWMDEGECVSVKPETWDRIPPENRRRICTGCQVRTQCLQLLGRDHPMLDRRTRHTVST